MTETLRFERFELLPRERRLTVQGRQAHVGSRAFDLLHALAARPERLMTKSELLDIVWPGLVVEESNLHVQMSALRKLLGDDVIATVPGRGYRMVVPPMAAPQASPEAPAGATPAAVTVTAARVSAAALPTLVGRTADLDAVLARLQQARCVSVVGPSGVGKTSLARAVVAQRPGDALWADLASLSSGTALPAAVARAGGRVLADGEALPQLVAMLDGAPQLLVLDNAEHLVGAVAELAETLLNQLPQLSLLVTSQLALQGSWEAVHRLEPLPLAAVDGAQTLLAQRIVAADRRWKLDDSARPMLDAICRQLDGLPLALEMAATRVPVLGLKRVHDELAHRFDLLTTGHRQAAPRHRTLHAALDWSYGLLAAEEQRLFRALGAWAGGFTLDLAVAQMTGEGLSRWDVIDHLASLVDRSLVVASAEDPPRYRLLETMRAYAQEQLVALGEEDAVRRGQGQVLLALLRFGEEENVPTTPERRAEIENMEAALPWLLQHDFAAAAELCSCCATHDTFTPWRNQTSRWMEATESRMRGSEGQALPAPLRLGWWTAFARTLALRINVRRFEVAREACALARAAGDAEQLHLALIVLVRSHDVRSEEADAAAAEIEALAAAHPTWPPRRRLGTVGSPAHLAMRHGDNERMLALRQQELALAQEMGNGELADMASTNVLGSLVDLRRLQEAVQMGLELLPRLERQGSQNLPWAYSQTLCALQALGQQGEFDALLPRALAHAWQAGTFAAVEPVLQLLANQRRWHDGARVLGLVYRLESDGDVGVSTAPGATRHMRETLACEFDAATLQRLLAEGAALDEAGVLALALDHDRPQA